VAIIYGTAPTAPVSRSNEAERRSGHADRAKEGYSPRRDLSSLVITRLWRRRARTVAPDAQPLLLTSK